MSAATLAGGLQDPVHDAQRIFRTVLDAMSHPGRPYALQGRYGGLAGLGDAVPATVVAALLSLADFETPVWLQAGLAEQLGPLLRFHAGTPITVDTQRAAFAVARAANLPALDAFAWGSAEYPDRSTTLLLVVDSFVGGEPLTLSGPGIATPFSFAPAGLPPDFWRQRQKMQSEFPRGVDCLLFDRESVAALPRTTVAQPRPKES
jgi:alpha-D-ribose 1-methylphosphonate 5-triphosphate synthase subunit PhnH